MRRFEEKRSVQMRVLVIAAALIVAGGVASSSCVFETTTNFCAQFDLHCREGQQCAANQAVCIDIGGCGNGILDANEVCDDGNIVDGEGNESEFVADSCNSNCTSTQECGNEIVDAGEQCDEGTRNGDANVYCDLACRFMDKVCGNSMIEPIAGEECDPGPIDSISCNSNTGDAATKCKPSRCGDGYKNATAMEECDSKGMNTEECIGLQCKFSKCGDNVINEIAGETCEVGLSGNDIATCNGSSAGPAKCRVAMCGDGHINMKFQPPGSTSFEACDNADGIDTTSCNGNNGGISGPGSCQPPSCGDGYQNIKTGEECDVLGGSNSAVCIGNSAPEMLKCKTSRCGDGYENTTHEECDNLGGADTNSCNGKNAGTVSCHDSRCGDGYANIMGSEECDVGMGNTTDCNGSAATVAAVRCKNTRCGDGYVNETIEECDTPGGVNSNNCNGHAAGAVKCKFSMCGDGYTNTADNEQCDPGINDSMMCNGPSANNRKCKLAACGDGYVNAVRGEQCDNNFPCASPMQCMSCLCVMMSTLEDRQNLPLR